MALFGKKKTVEAKVEDAKEVKTSKAKTTKAKTTKKEKATAPSDTKVSATPSKEGESVQKNQYSYRITEKATKLADKNVYVLNIPKTENKTELKKVLESKYKVNVLKINIVNSPKKEKVTKGRYGMRGGGKKAYITLKAGDSIVL
jgi:large subunit ribosomal protein L23